MPVLDKTDWAKLIPHQGSMCLLDAVRAFDAKSIDTTTATHRSTDNPLRRNEQLHAVHLCEYGAQAMALHGALLARAAGSVAWPGYLVVLRDVQLEVSRIDDLPGVLDVHAERLAADADTLQYAFRVTHAARMLAGGRVLVSLR